MNLEDKLEEIIHTMRGVVTLKQEHLEKKVEQSNELMEMLNSGKDGIEIITSVSAQLAEFEKQEEDWAHEIKMAESQLIRLYKYLVEQHGNKAKEN